MLSFLQNWGCNCVQLCLLLVTSFVPGSAYTQGIYKKVKRTEKCLKSRSTYLYFLVKILHFVSLFFLYSYTQDTFLISWMWSDNLLLLSLGELLPAHLQMSISFFKPCLYLCSSLLALQDLCCVSGLALQHPFCWYQKHSWLGEHSGFLKTIFCFYSFNCRFW